MIGKGARNRGQIWDNETAGQVAPPGRYTPLVPRPEGGAMVSITPRPDDNDSPRRANGLGRIQGRAKRRAVYERHDYKCAHCGKQFAPHADGLAPSVDYRDKRGVRRVCALEVDHIVPRIAGGTSDLDNLQALCTQCNARKGHQIP